jgi:hypothetical protein
MPDSTSDKKASTMADKNSAHSMEANFSTLVLSIGSSAAMALGLAPNPMTNKIEKDLNLARFNIDLLQTLADKTKGNLTQDEQRFLDSLLTDLQMKFVQAK